MAGPDGFSNPFETSSSRNPSAIGSGRGRNGGDNNNNNNNNGNSRADGHSPSSKSDLQPNRARGDPAAILIRKLPTSTSKQMLRSMLLFSRECDGFEFVKSTPADQPLASAIARFRTSEGAHQAKELLNGRPTDDGLEMKVEIINLTPGGSFNSPWPPEGMDGTGGGHRSSTTTTSRFGETFQRMERISPRSHENSSRSGDGVAVDGVSPTFKPARLNAQSPIGHGLARGGERVSGLSVIQQDETDDETTRILEDPASFLSPEHQQLLYQQGAGRRATAPTLPSGIAERFGSLSINSGIGSSNGFVSPSSVTSPRGFGGTGSIYSGTGGGSSGVNGMHHYSRGSISNATSPTSRYPPGIHSPVGYGGRPGQFFPPVNPADQNPPCNTLYVGNLPLDTSEDELKALFSKQRGYKRLCFRTKQNGPMCFVEFEEIQWATRALNELYGTMLSNSVRGGIRLSFSKNPLGVRGPPQQSPISPNPNMQAAAAAGIGFSAASQMASSFGPMSPPGFSTASGPPPGLPAPQSFHGNRTNNNSGGSSSSGGSGSSNGGGGGGSGGINGRDSRNGNFGSYYGAR